MHVVIAILGALISILYLLDRVGIDIGWLNPFHWRHRRAWAKRHDTDPIYSVEDPLHVAALLVIGAVRLDGEVSAEQKRTALQQFRDTFSMDDKEAADLYTAASHLLGSPQVIDKQLSGLVERNRGRLSAAQSESMLQMLVKVASADGALSSAQRDYIDQLRQDFAHSKPQGGTWA